MKTAISIADDLFEKTDKVAKDRHISRSKLIAEALKEYIEKYENIKMLEAINSAYDNQETDFKEKEDLSVMLLAHKKLLDKEKW